MNFFIYPTKKKEILSISFLLISKPINLEPATQNRYFQHIVRDPSCPFPETGTKAPSGSAKYTTDRVKSTISDPNSSIALVILASLLGIVVVFFDLFSKSFLIFKIDYKVGFAWEVTVDDVDHLIDDKVTVLFSVAKVKWIVGIYRVVELSFSFPYFERKSHIIFVIGSNIT